MTTRKLFKVGKSIVIEIPEEVLLALDMAEGDELVIEFDKALGRILIAKSGEYSGIDEEFASEVNDFIDEYRPALEVLANKRKEK